VTARSDHPPIRVERALALLPDLDVLAPLRSFVVSLSRGGRLAAEPYRTVGKRTVHSTELRALIPRAVGRLADHLSALYEAAIEALEAEERGDLSSSVHALLAAGEREEAAGRPEAARIWYEHALRIAEQLRDRRPELVALRRIGRLDASRGDFEGAARFYQRSFALAEAELDQEGAALACRGLGDIAVERRRWPGAVSWYTRALRHADASGPLAADLKLALADAARNQGDTDAAVEWMRQAHAQYRQLGRSDGMAAALNVSAQLDAAAGRRVRALARYQKALTLLAGAPSPELEVAIRLNVGHLHVDWGRLPDAEDEVRRAEELAIAHGLTRQLVRLYTMLGIVRGRQGDEAGFVFFEKAIELCQGRDAEPQLEAAACLEYARFRRDLGDLEECRVYVARVRELLEKESNGEAQARLEAELTALESG
jgi:tetratricopeptide (TPR) repeat protein